ncbi:hypothetical protein DYJ26_22120 [Salmonella enterica]|nr:hypothetical protein [Salmonella enterica]
MIRNIIKSLFRKRTRYPRTGWFYMTSSGHIVRVLLVDQETQKVVCALLGAGYQLSIPLIAFHTDHYFKRPWGAA